MINSNCLFEPDSLFYQINTIDHIFMEKRNRFLGMLEEKEKKAQSIGSEIPVLTFLTKEILFIAQEYFQTKDALLKDYSLLLKNIES